MAAAAADKPSPRELEAMKNVRRMLEPNKLGGADRTFNFADRDAIVSGLMRDTNGLAREVPAQLRAEGKNFAAGAAERGLNGGWGPIAKAAKKRVYAEAPGQIGGQLDQGLREANVDPATGNTRDNVRREISFAELRAFEADAAVLQTMQERVANKLGMDVLFPGGVSAKSIDHTLHGRFGLPPGAKLVPRE